jgi:hypothetical protein
MNCSTNCVTHVHFTFSAHSPQSSSADRNYPFYISADAPYDRKTNRHYIGKHSSQKMCPQPLTDWHVRVKLATRARAQFCCVALAWELPPWHLSLVGMRCNGREPKQMRTPFGHCLSAFALLFLSTSSFLKFGFSFVFGSFSFVFVNFDFLAVSTG